MLSEITLLSAAQRIDFDWDEVNPEKVYGRYQVLSHTDDQAVVLIASPHDAYVFFDTITHVHREDLEHFRLRPYRDWFVGAFTLPRGLVMSAGLIPAGKPISTEREQWIKHIETATALDQESERVGNLTCLRVPASGEVPAAPYPVRKPQHHTLFDIAAPDGHRFSVEAWADITGGPSLLLLTDGNRYVNSYPFAPQCSTAYFSTTNAQDRGTLLCNAAVLEPFLADQLLPWLHGLGVNMRPADTAIAGASFGGLAAARTVRRRPDLVENAIVQSASFWFDPEELAAWQKPLAGPPRRIFHEIGTLETALSSSTPTKKDSMGSVNQEFARCLQSPHQVSRQFVGGHDYAPWREGVIAGIQHLKLR
ncbi:alpha/beta hydrolase [Corynebacterium simulans]|uniref:Esterase family protein n=1 Tax=Corynebacterium simulans TaxID=146827 RepID=A0ABR5VA24_9CORY|nr:alpha/beta hydrolase-fold protein [Corynebacterium simulans]KXU18454.1 esterase family protein [Corynebacterium simulans]